MFLDPDAQDREHSYVEASRSRPETRLYAAGEDFQDLQTAMTRSRKKHLATTIAQSPELSLSLAR